MQGRAKNSVEALADRDTSKVVVNLPKEEKIKLLESTREQLNKAMYMQRLKIRHYTKMKRMPKLNQNQKDHVNIELSGHVGGMLDNWEFLQLVEAELEKLNKDSK